MEDTSTCGRFKKNVLLLARNIGAIASRIGKKALGINPALIDAAAFFLDSEDSERLLTTFLVKSYPYWEKIRSCDENLVQEHCEDLFCDLDPKYSQVIANVWNSELIDEENRAVLWNFFHNLVKICIKYAATERSCVKYLTPEIVENWGVNIFALEDLQSQRLKKSWGGDFERLQEKFE